MPVPYNCFSGQTTSSGQNEQDLAWNRQHRGMGTRGGMNSVLTNRDQFTGVDGEEGEGINEDGDNSVDGGGGRNGMRPLAKNDCIVPENHPRTTSRKDSGVPHQCLECIMSLSPFSLNFLHITVQTLK